jgi:hypothetical protein
MTHPSDDDHYAEHVHARAVSPARPVEPKISATALTRPPRRCRQRPLASLAAAICAIAIGACGSPARKPSGSSHASSGLAFSQCMRSHGVPAYPDPSPGGGGGDIINLGKGFNPASPAFQAAQATCNKLLPGAGPSAHTSEQQDQQMFAISKCMRHHGVSGFPDPIIRTTPPSNSQDYSIVEGRGEVWLLVPSTINATSPAFEQAANACALGPKHAR